MIKIKTMGKHMYLNTEAITTVRAVPKLCVGTQHCVKYEIQIDTIDYKRITIDLGDTYDTPEDAYTAFNTYIMEGGE